VDIIRAVAKEATRVATGTTVAIDRVS
jgi:hypothetical protein